MKLSQILEQLDILACQADTAMEIEDIVYDSRNVTPGSAFVAVRGFETDGHRYIPQAAAKGAAVVLCEEAPSEAVPYVLVKDSRKALALAARNFFGDPSAALCVIGVTGTNGKTTSTYLLKHLLEQTLGAKVGLIGTNGNMIGNETLSSEHTTPESRDLQALFAQMRDAGCTHVVMEVSSHSLDLGRVDGVHFAVGLFTNLTQDHLDYHKTMENYAAAKAKLFARCEKAAVNFDDEWSGYMLQNAACPVLTYSAKSDAADLVARDIQYSAAGVKFCAVREMSIERVKLAIPGTFSVYNALGVLACMCLLGVPLRDAAPAMATATGVKGRVEVVPTDGDYTILIDYAHTPDALENVLKSMQAVTQGRLVALFGCGGDRDKTKRPKMGKIAAENADLVIVTSDNPRTEQPDAIIQDILAGIPKGTAMEVIPDRKEAIAWAIAHHQPGDVILLAGKGHEDYQIIGKTKIHLDEREVVADVLRKRRERA